MFPALLPTYNRADVAFVRGEGSYLFAEDGRRYLDFGAGIAVNAFGHANPKLVKALTDQAGKLWHTSNMFRVRGAEELADKICRDTFASRVFFTTPRRVPRMTKAFSASAKLRTSFGGSRQSAS